MPSLHALLKTKSPRYASWHTHPLHAYMHWSVFIYTSLFLTLVILGSMGVIPSIPGGSLSRKEALRAYQPQEAYAAGNTYYVATDGSDGNTCAQAKVPATPFATMRRILNTSNPCSVTGGDTIEVRASVPGGMAIYTDQFDCNADVSQCIPGGSSWSSPLILKARPGDIIIIKPNSGNRVFSFDNANQQYIEISGFIIDGTNTSGILTWIEDSAHHIRFKDNEI